ncbi:dynamin GTPase domain-containing protein [Fusarium mexicanum]|uniref:Dynamin GTPase domain-containing protein n=1 Tax=Fusarium mexicanum TaxID=751941 RepID=A0A8H5JAQ1_9HYPO|nr:dynamin GTPase domain-containing protein [Fusarium mexicanum]
MSNIHNISPASLNELLSAYADVFDAVDSLQEAGMKRELVPKLVVTGDQSSGKSSVLEAICQVPFPVDQDLCTRFPIELIQRKADKVSIIVNISVVELTTNRDALNQFSRELIPNDSVALGAAIQDASSLILGNKPGSTNQRHFSRDVLRIIISGPEKYPLTLVDLPGFFQSSNMNQNEKDKEIVDEIVAPYLREPRNGILLIMPAHVLWNVLRAPSEVACAAVDPAGTRTLGIFTALDKSTYKDQIKKHFSGQESWCPQNGWHGLKNLSTEERRQGENRDEVERAFFAKKWPEIDRSCKGIENLRPKLSEFLANQIRENLGGLINDVETEIKTLDAELERLGRKKTTEQQQRDYLSRMAGDFRQLCYSAVQGHYSEEFFNDPKDSAQKSQDKRLQSVSRALGQQFISTMIEKGKKTQLQPTDCNGEVDFPQSLESRLSSRLRTAFKEHIHDALLHDNDGERAIGSPRDRPHERRDSSERAGTRRHKDARRGSLSDDVAEKDDHNDVDSEHDNSDENGDVGDEKDQSGDEDDQEELSRHDTDAEDSIETGQQDEPATSTPSFLRADIVEMYESFALPTKRSFKDFETQVLAMAVQWRGTESLDDVNPAMVSRLYREETSHWEAIANCHLRLVWDAVIRFVDLALKHCVDSSLLKFLERSVINSRLELLRLSAEAKLQELVRCHQGTNPGFHDFLREFQDESLEFSNRVKPDSFDARKVILERIDATLSATAFEKILELSCQSIGGVIPSKTMVASAVLSQIKDIVAGQIPTNSTQHGSSGRYHQDTERGAVRRSITMIEKYYKLSLISFIAYVNALVIHNGLLEKVPDEIFTHTIVSEQSAKTISYIAGEKEKDTKKRLDCERKLGILQKALVALENFRNND